METSKYSTHLEDIHNQRTGSVDLHFGSNGLGEICSSTTVKVSAVDGTDIDTGNVVTVITLRTESVKGCDVTQNIAREIARELGWFTRLTVNTSIQGWVLYELTATVSLSNAYLGMVYRTIFDLQSNS